MGEIESILQLCPLRTAAAAQRVLGDLSSREPRELWMELGTIVHDNESVKVATVPLLCASLLFIRQPLNEEDTNFQQFGTQLLHIIPQLDWDVQAPLIPETVSELFSRIAQSPIIPDKDKRALANAALAAIEPSGLTSIHTALPGTPLSLEELECTFDRRFPPAHKKDLSRYFLSGAQLFDSYQSWCEAATYAALALTVYDTAINHKLKASEEDSNWVPDPASDFNESEMERVSLCHSLHMLYEILAYGHYDPLTLLPYTNALILKSPFSSTVRDMTRLFNEPFNAQNNQILRDLVSSRADLLKTWRLWHLAERVLLKYRIQWLHSLHVLAPRLLWADLIDTGTESLDSLLAAGYGVDIEQQHGATVVSRKAPQASARLAVLKRAARLCKKIEAIK